MDGSEDLILSLYAKGMSVRDIQNHFDDLYGYERSTQTISNITDKIMFKVGEWQNRPLEAIYPKAEVQRCIVYQIRSSLRFVSWKDRKAVAKDLKGIYTALNEEQALLSLDEFRHIWDKKYPNIAKSWQSHWTELSTFFKYPQSIRTLIYTTNPIESLNAIIKQKTKSKGAFPTQGSALKMVYLATQQIQEKWQKTRVRNWSKIYPLTVSFLMRLWKNTGNS